MPEKRIRRSIELTYVAEPDVFGDSGGLVEYDGRMIPDRVGVNVRHSVTKGAQRPLVEIRYEIRAGRRECVGVNVTSHPGERGISSAELGMLDLDALGREAFDNFATTIKRASGDDIELGTIGDAKRMGSRQIEGLLRDVALAFLDPVNRDAPAKAVAKIPQLRGYHPRQIARYIAKARAANLIPEAGARATDEELDTAHARLTKGESNGEA